MLVRPCSLFFASRCSLLRPGPVCDFHCSAQRRPCAAAAGRSRHAGCVRYPAARQCGAAATPAEQPAAPAVYTNAPRPCRLAWWASRTLSMLLTLYSPPLSSMLLWVYNTPICILRHPHTHTYADRRGGHRGPAAARGAPGHPAVPARRHHRQDADGCVRAWAGQGRTVPLRVRACACACACVCACVRQGRAVPSCVRACVRGWVGQGRAEREGQNNGMLCCSPTKCGWRGGWGGEQR